MKYQRLLTERGAVAVVGAGAMGSGIAQVAAAAGHEVILHDSRPQAAAQAVAGAAKALQRQVGTGKLAQETADSMLKRIRAAESLNDCAPAALVIEAIVEDLAAKRALFSVIEDMVAEDAILATNTSSFSITRIAVGLRRPDRLVGMHFFNPAPVMQLVEVVSGLATLPEAASAIFHVAQAWGKVPVHAKSSPGFIVNRVARPYYAEALRLLTEGAADAATIDAVMRDAGGFRMGPFELMDLIGHDVNYAVTESVFEAFYGDRRFAPSLAQLELVNAGFLGRKSGRGFYDHTAGAGVSTPRSAPPSRAPLQTQLFNTDSVCSSFVRRIADACGIALTEPNSQVTGAPGCLIALPEEDMAMLYLSDGRTATERAHETGQPSTILLDLALDYAECKRVAVSWADQCSPRAREAMVGLLQSAGWTVTVLDDVPGLAVLRTVAMLANEAADTVYQGICEPDAVDLAMRKGVNYPRGPLAWAAEIGHTRVCRVLENLQRSYGEERYRTSPWLRRKAMRSSPRRSELAATN